MLREYIEPRLTYFRLHYYRGYIFRSFAWVHPRNELDALLISIAKWVFLHRMVKAHDKLFYDGGVLTCGLCCYFNDCYPCPLGSCRNTPYEEYTDIFNNKRWMSSCEEGLAAIDAEIEHLISFVPEELRLDVQEEVAELIG